MLKINFDVNVRITYICNNTSRGILTIQGETAQRVYIYMKIKVKRKYHRCRREILRGFSCNIPARVRKRKTLAGAKRCDAGLYSRLFIFSLTRIKYICVCVFCGRISLQDHRHTCQ